MRPVWPVLVAIAMPAALLAAEPVEWRVVSVHDGDTLTALDAAKVQMAGIDAVGVG